MRRIDTRAHEDRADFVGRRDFLRVCTMAAASLGLPAAMGLRMAEAAIAGLKPSVIWLHFQECTGCTESLLRTSHPDLATLILDMISLDYHETLFAAAGHQVEAALELAIAQNAGKYICVVEGAIPVKDGGVYCKIGGKTAMEILDHVGSQAGAVVAIGSCAVFGGVAAAEPNPTGATGVEDLLKGKPLINLPGCPSNPYNFLGTALHYVTTGQLPELDAKLRPKFAYGRTVHDDCTRRTHFDAGRFAEQFDDEGHRAGFCLYKLGCKGPSTHANCAINQFGDVGGWPIGVGHPCVGCTEKDIAFRMPMHDLLPLQGTPPPGLRESGSGLGTGALVAGAAGVAGAAILGFGVSKAAKQDNDGTTTGDGKSTASRGE